MLILGNLILVSGVWTTNWLAGLIGLGTLAVDVGLVVTVVRRRRLSAGQGTRNAGGARAGRNAQPAAKKSGAPHTKTAKPARESWMHKRVKAFQDQYRLPPIPQLGMPVRLDAPDQLRYSEVIDAVYTCKNAMRLILSDRLNCDAQMREILSCPGCKSDRQKLRHLKSYRRQLDSLYARSAALTQELTQQKVALSDHDPALTTDMYQAFAYLLSCVDAKGVAPARDFVETIDPLDMSLFVAPCKPAQIRMGGFTFALFSNVILVFDGSGTFTTALRPQAFSCMKRSRARTPTLRFVIGSVSQEVLVPDAGALRAIQDTVARYMQSDSAAPDRIPQLLALLELVSDPADPDLASLKAVCEQNGTVNRPICTVHTTR